IEHSSLPLMNYAVNTVNTHETFDAASAYTLQNVPFDLTDSPLPLILDLCSSVVNVQERSNAVTTELVNNTLIPTGSPIELLNGPHAAVSVTSSNGQLIYSGNSQSISTHGWGPGIYVVRAFDRSGDLKVLSRVAIF
ncbi:MAG: hypothetical protein M3R08_04450, partial [Bacteroidota bacterium]|nr:hypothetical protein [Bacteroidota bacterium]